MASLLLIFGDDVVQNNLFQKGDTLYRKHLPLLEFRYDVALRLISLSTFRHYQKRLPILDEHLPKLSINLLLSKRHASLYHHHQQLLSASLDIQILWLMRQLVRKILIFQQILVHKVLLPQS